MTDRWRPMTPDEVYEDLVRRRLGRETLPALLGLVATAAGT